MRPFKIIFQLKTPLVNGLYPFHFDGLLYSLLRMRISDDNKADNEMDQLLKKTDGVYHSSSMIFGVTRKEGLIAKNTTVVRKMGDQNLGFPHYYPDAKNGCYSKVKEGEGWQKSELKEMKTVFAPYVVFYGFGDPERISPYLDNCLLGLGVNSRRMGFGGVDRFWINEVKTDLSMTDLNFRPSRTLPIELYRKMGGKCDDTELKKVRVTFPYFESVEVDGVSPKRTRSEFVDTKLLLN